MLAADTDDYVIFLSSFLLLFSTLSLLLTYSIARQFNGIMDLYRKTVKSDGPVGIYRGFCVSVLGVFVYRGLYFGLYDSCKPMLGSWREHWLGNFALGWAVTITAGMAYYPIDTVRRRIIYYLSPFILLPPFHLSFQFKRDFID